DGPTRCVGGEDDTVRSCLGVHHRRTTLAKKTTWSCGLAVSRAQTLTNRPDFSSDGLGLRAELLRYGRGDRCVGQAVRRYDVVSSWPNKIVLNSSRARHAEV